MTALQELEAFEAQVQTDEVLRTLLEDLIRSVADEGEPASRTRFDPTAGLWLVGVAALWKLASVGIDHLRGLSESAQIAKQLDLVREMQALGCEPKQATQMVARLLKELRTRPAHDVVLKRLLELWPR